MGRTPVRGRGKDRPPPRSVDRPAGEIVRLVNVTRLAQAEFTMAVALATGVIDYLPGDGSGSGPDPAKQEQHFRDYAARLFDGHADPWR